MLQVDPSLTCDPVTHFLSWSIKTSQLCSLVVLFGLQTLLSGNVPLRQPFPADAAVTSLLFRRGFILSKFNSRCKQLYLTLFQGETLDFKRCSSLRPLSEPLIVFSSLSEQLPSCPGFELQTCVVKCSTALLRKPGHVCETFLPKDVRILTAANSKGAGSTPKGPWGSVLSLIYCRSEVLKEQNVYDLIRFLKVN